MKTDFNKKIIDESALWVEEGIIASEVRERIVARYREQDAIDDKAGSSRLISTLSVMGAVMVGLGVILFIASNWAEIARPLRVAIIMAGMLVSYALGWWLRHEREGRYPKVGAALMLLGAIIYGAGIFLIAQIYNVSVHYPNGLLYWWLGVLPLAYLLRLTPMLALTLLTMLIWMGCEADFRIINDHFFRYAALYLLAGVTLWDLGHLHGLLGKWGGRFARAYYLTGLLLVFAVLFFATFDDFFRVYSWRKSQPMAPDNIASFYWGMGLLLAGSMIARGRLVMRAAAGEATSGLRQRLMQSMDAPVMVALAALAVYFGLWFAGVKESPARDYALAANVLYAFFIVCMIIMGYFRRMQIYINMGLVFFAIDITARYFDYFWKLLPRSIFFMIGGLMLLGGGVLLERQRRKVLNSFGRQGSVL